MAHLVCFVCIFNKKFILATSYTLSGKKGNQGQRWGRQWIWQTLMGGGVGVGNQGWKVGGGGESDEAGEVKLILVEGNGIDMCASTGESRKDKEKTLWVSAACPH